MNISFIIIFQIVSLIKNLNVPLWSRFISDSSGAFFPSLRSTRLSSCWYWFGLIIVSEIRNSFRITRPIWGELFRWFSRWPWPRGRDLFESSVINDIPRYHTIQLLVINELCCWFADISLKKKKKNILIFITKSPFEISKRILQNEVTKLIKNAGTSRFSILFFAANITFWMHFYWNR